jgi:hypothetical protein
VIVEGWRSASGASSCGQLRSGHGREDDAEEVEDDIAFLERLPKEGSVADYVDAVLGLEENLSSYEGGDL